MDPEMRGVLSVIVEFAKALVDYREWTLVSFICFLLLTFIWWYRRDSRKALEILAQEHSKVLVANAEATAVKDKRVGELLEQRHEQFVNVFDRVIGVLNNTENAVEGLTDKVSDLEKRVERSSTTVATQVTSLEGQVKLIDQRCDERQKAKASSESERKRRGSI